MSLLLSHRVSVCSEVSIPGLIKHRYDGVDVDIPMVGLLQFAQYVNEDLYGNLGSFFDGLISTFLNRHHQTLSAIDLSKQEKNVRPRRYCVVIVLC